MFIYQIFSVCAINISHVIGELYATPSFSPAHFSLYH